MSKIETFKRSKEHATEARNASIFELIDDMKAAISTLENQTRNAEQIEKTIRLGMSQMPEQMAQGILPLAAALDKQSRQNRAAIIQMLKVAKASLRQHQSVTTALKEQSKILATRHLKLEGELQELRVVLNQAKPLSLRGVAVAVGLGSLVPTAAVLWLAWMVGISPF